MNCEIIKKETLDLMLEHYDINKLNKDNNWDCKTYNFMGARYYNNIFAKNDVPQKGKIISFSGYTGPRYLIDFDNHIVIVLMCNIVHGTFLDREQRFNITKEIVFKLYDDIKKINLISNDFFYII